MIYGLAAVLVIYLVIGFDKVITHIVECEAQAKMWGRNYDPPMRSLLLWLVLWPKYL